MLNSIITFFTQSSENPEKTSATLTGILIALSSQLQQLGVYIPLINHFYLSPVGQQMDVILTAAGTIVGTTWFLYGIFRKLTNKVESKKGLAV